jgi:hypothetical protein
MRIIALIDDAGVIERILTHLSLWNPQPENRSPAGRRPPLHAMPACPTFKTGDQLRHEESPAVLRSTGLNDTKQFPILRDDLLVAALRR